MYLNVHASAFRQTISFGLRHRSFNVIRNNHQPWMKKLLLSPLITLLCNNNTARLGSSFFGANK